jgi:hypothetical protein
VSQNRAAVQQKPVAAIALVELLQQLVDFECQYFERRQPCSDRHVLVIGSVNPFFPHHCKGQVDRNVLNWSRELWAFTHGAESISADQNSKF